MTKSQAIKKLKNIFKDNRVKYSFIKDGSGGTAYPKESFIMVNVEESNVTDIVSGSLHELSHVLLYRQGKYFTYHDVSRKSIKRRMTVKNKIKLFKHLIKIGLRAEKFTDKFAQKLMAKYFPNMTYRNQYEEKWQIKWYRDNVTKPYKRYIRERM